MIGSDARAVLSHYGLAANQVRSIEPLGNAGGWSGSRLWRVTVRRDEKEVGSLFRQESFPHGPRSSEKDSRPPPLCAADAAAVELCLRRWPVEHPTTETLRWIHSVLLRVAPQLPVVACPLRTVRGESYVEHAGHLWELTRWLPGQADFHANPNRVRLRAAMQTLARFHELAESGRPGEAACPPAVLNRRRKHEEWRHGGIAEVERSLQLRLSSEIDAVGTRLLTLVRRAIETSPVWRSLDASIRLPLQPVIRDIHHDHVLFTGDEVSGIIDFGAMRIDTRLTDVARLVGSLVGDDLQARQFAFDAYSELQPLSNTDRKLIDVLDESGVVLGGLNWLKWLYVERRDMGPMKPIAKRLEEIVRRLERFAPL